MRSTTHMRLEDFAAVSTRRVRFYVATKAGNRVPVLGEVVDVAPHLSAKFAVHEAVDGIGGWSVSDMDSGGRAGFAQRQADAIADATANLSKRTDADMHLARERLRQILAEV